MDLHNLLYIMLACAAPPKKIPPPPQNNVCTVSCLVFLTNAAHSYIIWCKNGGNDTYLLIYSHSFLFLTATSVVFHTYRNKITNFIDRAAVFNILLQGGRLTWIAVLDHAPAHKLFFIVTSCVLVIYTHIDHIINEAKYGEFEINLRHAILIHFLSSIGHHAISDAARSAAK